MISQEEVRDNFIYKEDGGLYWKISNRWVSEGDKVTNKCNHGYLHARLGGRKYKAHHLVWVYHHGYTPEHEIDHVNRVRDDNRIENLREVTRQCNCRNSCTPKNNLSGVKGVCWKSAQGKWYSYLMIDYKQKSLGHYLSFEEAVLARLAGEQCTNWNWCDRDSPAYKYYKENICNE